MTTDATRTPSRQRPSRRWVFGVALVVAVLIVAALNVKVVAVADLETTETFDPAAFAEERFTTEIVPQIEEDAVDLVTLLGELANGAEPADFGNTSGAGSAFAYPVILTAVAGTPAPPALPLTVEGVPADVVVQLQIGPALNGTAIRDVTGTISFNQFVNQLEYQNVSTALNDQVRELVLAKVDPASLAGRTLRITGAFLRVNPEFISIVPVKVEVLP
ncbi:DUF2291 domain-containing protein [soil metagenome]